MKLFEMQQLPQKAGMTLLEFSPNSWSNPTRNGQTIILPKRPEDELFSLKGGQQFLFRCAGRTTSGSEETQFWFGGTEENAFLVRLTQPPFSAFQKDGETGFFAALKPKAVTKCETAFNVPTRRQGDIFAVAIPYSWQELSQALLLCHGEECTPKKVTDQSLFETRHTFTGRFGKARVFGEQHCVGEGIISAPDHSPLSIKNGVYIIAQASGLFSSKVAD